MLLREFISNRLRKYLYEDYHIVNRDDFNDALSNLATLDLEDDQVRYPKTNGRESGTLFSANDYDVYILDNESLPNSGSFELSIDNNDGDTIGFVRGTKSGNIISFNLIHIKDEYRGSGIGSDIYEKLLNNGFIMKSDSEITHSTYGLYDKLVLRGYNGIVFDDGRVGLKK